MAASPIFLTLFLQHRSKTLVALTDVWRMIDPMLGVPPAFFSDGTSSTLPVLFAGFSSLVLSSNPFEVLVFAGIFFCFDFSDSSTILTSGAYSDALQSPSCVPFLYFQIGPLFSGCRRTGPEIGLLSHSLSFGFPESTPFLLFVLPEALCSVNSTKASFSSCGSPYAGSSL